MGDRRSTLQWAFVAGFTGGVLILLGAVALALTVPFAGGMAAMMGSWWAASAEAMAAWGVATGAVAVFAATRVRSEPKLAGALLVATGALSVPAMGGFMLGAVATIAGGAFALSVAPVPEASPGAAARP